MAPFYFDGLRCGHSLSHYAHALSLRRPRAPILLTLSFTTTSAIKSSSHSSSDFLYGATTAPLGLISRNNSGIINSGSGNGSSSSNSCSGSSGTDVNNSVSRENVYSSGFQDPQRQFGASESCAMDGRCVVCLQARARVAFFPCRHMKVCKVCADECDTCPICRAKIKDKHVIYF